VLTCGERLVKSDLPKLVTDVERTLRLRGRAQRAPAGSPLATLTVDERLTSHLFLKWRRLLEKTYDHDRGKPLRVSAPDGKVVAAATALIAFVQSEYRELEDDEPLPALLALQLSSIESLAFAAMHVPRGGNGEAKRIRLNVSANAPLSCCTRCRKVWADKPKLSGGALATLCPVCSHA
jgi:hypothetical protein